MTSEHTITIDWADLDLFGHVNNVMFFKYMQASRLRFCENLGLTSLNERGKISFLVASSSCAFKRPLHYPGTVTVRTSASWVKNTSFCLKHVITDAGGEVAAEGEDVLVLFDYHQHKKVTVSAELRSGMGVE